MNVRKLALETIDKILEKCAYSNIIVNEYLKKFELSVEDKALYTRLVYGTIQNLYTLEFYLEPFLKRKKPKHYIYYLLCMSVYQIVYLDIPNYAVLDESVKIARVKDASLSSFVNGVLRSFIRTPLRDIMEIKRSDNDIKYLSIRYSYPDWLIAYLLKDYTFDEVKMILEENSGVKNDAIRINTIKTNIEEVKSELRKLDIGYEEISIVPNGLIVKKSIIDTELFKKGMITVQDISSQMVGEVCAPKENSLVIDLCSAPGGKSAHISALMNNTGKIYSCDVYSNKIKLMNSFFKRLGVNNAVCEQIDARLVQKYVKEMSFDYVIADVPCSGLGVMSHKVDLKYRINLESINEILSLQKEILESTWNLVKKNGYYLYSTCTINKDENEKMIKDFLENHPDFEIVYERQILPFEYHTDGFYICKMRRKDE